MEEDLKGEATGDSRTRSGARELQIPRFARDDKSERCPLEVCRQKRSVAMGGNGHENLGHGQHSLKCVGEGSGKFGSQKVDIQLQITRAVHAVHDE